MWGHFIDSISSVSTKWMLADYLVTTLCSKQFLFTFLYCYLQFRKIKLQPLIILQTEFQKQVLNSNWKLTFIWIASFGCFLDFLMQHKFHIWQKKPWSSVLIFKWKSNSFRSCLCVCDRKFSGCCTNWLLTTFNWLLYLNVFFYCNVFIY